jgi:hypothetical protein
MNTKLALGIICLDPMKRHTIIDEWSRVPPYCIHEIASSVVNLHLGLGLSGRLHSILYLTRVEIPNN